MIVGTGKELADPIRSKSVRTDADGDLVALLDVEGLKPFTAYHYDVLVDGRSAIDGPLPTFRTYPSRGQPARFGVGFGGGARNDWFLTCEDFEVAGNFAPPNCRHAL